MTLDHARRVVRSPGAFAPDQVRQAAIWLLAAPDTTTEDVREAGHALAWKRSAWPVGVRTEYDRKPGRMDGPEPFPYDWEAWLGDNYDLGDPIGFGATEEEAVANLLVTIEERADG